MGKVVHCGIVCNNSSKQRIETTSRSFGRELVKHRIHS